MIIAVLLCLIGPCTDWPKYMCHRKDIESSKYMIDTPIRAPSLTAPAQEAGHECIGGCERPFENGCGGSIDCDSSLECGPKRAVGGCPRLPGRPSDIRLT